MSLIETIAKELGISPSSVVRALDRIIAEYEKRYMYAYVFGVHEIP